MFRIFASGARFFAALLTLGCLWPILLSFSAPEWGFFAHRRINRLAVFTLPPEMIFFYKKHLEYVTEHSVDPDKRRYASRHEAVRHYIDIDHWGEYPFEQVPREWREALMRYADLYVIDRRGDSSLLFGEHTFWVKDGVLQFTERLDPRLREAGLRLEDYRAFFHRNIMPKYYEDRWTVDCDTLRAALGIDIDCRSALAVDRFSSYGILPYHLAFMQRQLTEAFRQKSVARILRLSAEIGHYIGDAHVPLHTTANYNGQFTGQEGIHAFWESRIPELFADVEYDFFVGKAEYIDNPPEYYWNVVLTSHLLVDRVLSTEKELSRRFSVDQQYCFEERLGATVRTQCAAYARAYQEAMSGMVERRMRDAIRAVGSAWHTAWVDAGRPDLRQLGEWKLNPEDIQALRELEARFRGGEEQGRPHDQ
jgi:hypothetical protein